MNKNKTQKVVILFSILLLPSLVYLFFNTGVNNFKTLPIIGPKILEEGSTTDTIYHTIPPFEFINQNNELVSSEFYKGKIYVADFFFATCPTICPKMAVHMRELQKHFYDVKDFKLLSITVNPEHDTPEVLNDYAKQVHAMDSVWNFLSGDKDKIYQLAYEGFLANAGQDDLAPGGYLHSSNLYLIDTKGRIRGIFDGTSTTETNNLKDAIKILSKEEFVTLK